MKKQFLISAVLTMATATAMAAPFEWTPAVAQPNPAIDVTQAWQVSTLRFVASGIDGVAKTDVMPAWIDEDGNAISAYMGELGWSAGEFEYYFDFSKFKSNGEYILQFPEGLLTNAAGDPSAKVEIPYTFDIPDLAGSMFEDFKVLSITPDLNAPQAIWKNQNITIDTNHNNAIGLTVLTITDVTENEVVCTSSNFATGREPGSDAPISWEVGGETKFYEEHSYVAVIEFYNGKDQHGPMGELTPKVDKVEYQFEGRVEGYKYSQVKLESVFPEPFSMIATPEDAVFVYTFSGPVTCYDPQTPMGSAGIHSYPASCLSSNEDKTVWTLNLSEDSFIRTIDSAVVINLYARDENGYQVKGNEGTEGNSCFQYSWACELGAFLIEGVNPEMGETLDELTEVVVRAADGQAMSVSWNGQASVWNLNREYFGTLYYDLPWDAEDTAFKEIRFTQWENASGVIEPISLKKAGSYVITFDSGYFVMGEQFDSKVSHSLNLTFIISGSNDDPDPGLDPSEQEVFLYERVLPEAGSTVTNLENLKLWYPDIVDTMGKDAVVYNKADQSVVTYGQVIYDWDDLYLINVELFDVVSEAGEYEVVIPSRAICTSEFFETDGKKGICNPEIRLSYTVDPSGTSVVSVSEASVCDIYDIHGRLVMSDASSAAIKSLPKGIYVAGGRKLIVK